MNRRLFLILGLILISSLSALGQSWISATHLVAPIEVRVDTLHGFFEVGHCDGRQLTAMYPNPSFGGSDIFGFYLDGTIYRSSFWGGGPHCDQNMDNYYLNTIYIPAENTIVSTWQVSSIGGNVIVRQKLTPVLLDDLGTIKIQYFIQNNSTMTHSIGIALKLDVKIHTRDNAPFAVGALWTPNGVAYAYPSIPQYWQAFLTNPTDTSLSNLIARGIINLYGATPPDSFVLGEATEFYGPGTGIKSPCWNIDRTHIGQPYYDSEALVRWGPQSIDPGDEIFFTTYYGFGSPPSAGEGLVITNLTPTTASISNCTYDTLSASILITNNNSDSTTHNVGACIVDSGGLSVVGSDCVTLSPDSLTPGNSGNAAWQLVIPPGYSASGDVVDTLIFATHNDESTLVTNDYDTLIFTTPFFDGLPPSDTVVFPIAPYVNCDTSIIILLHDNDAGVDPSLTRISYYDKDGFEHNLSSSDMLFYSSGDTIFLSIGDTLITAGSDTILLGDTVQFCITDLVDLYGCGISADECDTIFLDTEPPHITSIIPAPSSAMTSDSFTIRIFIEDIASGVDSTSIILTVDGVPYSVMPERLEWHLASNELDYNPSSHEFASEETLWVCLSRVGDNVQVCNANVDTAETCWYYWVDYSPPTFTPLIPNPSEVVACSCITDTFKILVHEPSGVDLSTLNLWIGPYHFTGFDVTMRGDTMCIYNPSDCFDEGDITVSIIELADNLGNGLESPFNYDFTVDYTAPAVGAPVPPDGSIINTLDWFVPITDDIYVDETSIIVSSYLNGAYIATYYLSLDPELSWSSPNLAIDLTGALTVSDGDTVRVCLDNVADLANYCGGPNGLDSPICWTYYIDMMGPQAIMTTPDDSSHTACANVPITIQFIDALSIDSMSIDVRVADSDYTVHEGTYNPATKEFSFTATVSEDCVWQEVRLVSVADSLGNIGDVASWYILPDSSAPHTGTFTFPGDGATVPHDGVAVEITDDCSWITRDSTVFRVDYINTLHTIYFSTSVYGYDSYVNWNGDRQTDTMFFHLSDMGTAPANNDSVRICLIHAVDSLDYAACGFNATPDGYEECFRYFMSLDGPVISLLSPPAGSYIACDSFPIIYRISDSDGITTSTITVWINGVPYRYGVYPSMDYYAVGESLVFAPPSFHHCDTLRILCDSVLDAFGTNTSVPSNVTLYVDTVPPLVGYNYPPCDIEISEPELTIKVVVDDPLCPAGWSAGVNHSSIEFGFPDMGGRTYGISSPAVTWSGDTAEFVVDSSGTTFVGGDTVQYCIRVRDNTIDLSSGCESNETEWCCRFWLSASGPEVRALYPPDRSVIGCPTVDSVMVIMTDSVGIDWSTVTINIAGTPYSGAALHIRDDSVVVVYITPPLTAEGVIIVRVEGENNLHNAIAGGFYEYTFSIDHSAPYVDTRSPTPCGITIDDNSPTITLHLTDDYGRVDTTDFWVVICSTWVDCDTYRVGDVGFYYDGGDTFRIETSEMGHSWGGGDSVRYFILRTVDDVDFCTNNIDSSASDSCTYFISAIGPAVTLISPPESISIGCSIPGFEWRLRATDAQGVDPATVRLEVTTTSSGTTTYPLGAALYYAADSTLIFHPSTPFANGDTITITLRAHDMLGNPEQPNEFVFFYDASPPGFDIILPPAYGSAFRLSPLVILHFPDITGPDTLSPIVHITGPGGVDEYFSSPDPAVNWIGDSMNIELSVRSISFTMGDTVTVCIDQITDAVDTCPHTNVIDSCWWFIVMQGGPEAHLLYPTSYRACPEDSFAWLFFDPDGIQDSTIRLYAPTGTYTVTDPELTFDEAESLLVFNPPFPISLEDYPIYLAHARDDSGYAMDSLTFRFTVDLTPPVATLLYPPSPTTDHLPRIKIDLTDSLDSVDSLSIELWVHGVIHTVGMPGLTWFRDGDSLIYDAALVGDTLFAGDTVRLCIYGCDSTGCTANNCDTTCYDIIIGVEAGPTVELLGGLADSSSISCTDSFEIAVLFTDSDGLRFPSIRLHYTADGLDTVYLFGDTELRWSGDTLYFSPPLGTLSDGTEMTVDIEQMQDIWGNPIPPTLWHFWIDRSGPEAVAAGPTGVVTVPRPDIWILLSDSSALDTLSPVLTVFGTTYHWGDSELSWHGDTLYFTPSASFPPGTTITVCLDTILDVTAICPPNNIDTAYCFDFNIAGGGPEADMIIPFDSMTTTCRCQEIWITLVDSEGVVDSSITIVVASDTISYPDPRLEFRSGITSDTLLTPDTLVYTPAEPCFSDGETVYVALIAAMDTIGNYAIQSEWWFLVDLSAPYADSIVPIPGSVVYHPSWQPEQIVYLRDTYNAVDTNCISVSITDNGTPMGSFGWSSPAWSYDPIDSSFHFDPTIVGLVFPEFHNICFDLSACDIADTMFCPANDTVISWCITIGDDDTIGPVITLDEGCAWPAFGLDTEIVLNAHIEDTSGVFDTTTADTSGCDIYVMIDTTAAGDFSDPLSLIVLPMWLPTGSPFDAQTLPGGFAAVAPYLHEGIPFHYIVCACDNDHDFNNSDDRTRACSVPESCYIYNIDPPVLTIHTPADGEYYSCRCGDQHINFTLLDKDGVQLDDMVISVNGVDYLYPDARITTNGTPESTVVVFTPEDSSECWQNGDTVNVAFWGYSDRYGNYPDTTQFWSFVVDWQPPSAFYPDAAETLLYSNEFGEIGIYLNDGLAGVNVDSIQLQVRIPGDGTVTLDTNDNALSFSSDTLYLDFRRLTAISLTARDSVFIELVRLEDNAVGCGANTAPLYQWAKYVKYETECQSHPKPFTPNGDNANDVVRIEYPRRFERDAVVTIYDVNNHEINRIQVGPGHLYEWDGTDSKGMACRQGVYIFVVEVGGKVVCSGTVVLAR